VCSLLALQINHMPVIQIPTSDIKIGMYVASLDRPWSETPFQFQGFEIHSQNDIEKLRSLSKNVYIMVPDEEIEVTRLSSDHTETMPASAILHKVTYSDTVPVGEEIRKVRQSHETISRLITEIESRVQANIPLRMQLIEQQVHLLVDSVINNPDAYLWLTRIRKFDSFLYKDSLTTAVWGAALGRQLGLPKQDMHNLAMGCIFMDVGKLALPSELLHKHARLEHDEWELMKTHVRRGLSILEADPYCTTDILDILRTHHERLDGSGYPSGLHGSQIPLLGQIAGIVDFYVSVTMPRPFAEPISPSKAEQMLYEQKGRYFDETLVEYFIQTLSTYPTGSLVELSTGEIGIVIAQNAGLRLKPDVVLLLNAEKKPYSTRTAVSLASYRKDDLPVTIARSLKYGEYGLAAEERKL
jgi:HD-GYP domain-containing protein (c-di-GMP phosphodiesterase class II)